MDWRQHPVVVLFASLALASASAAVAQTQPQTDDAKQQPLTDEERPQSPGDEGSASSDGANELPAVEVVGSRIKRTELEGPAPVIIIDREEIDQRGFVSIFDALQALSINTGQQLAPPEFTGGFTPNAQTVNLRGLGAGNTLVLINGRRIANYPAAFNSESSVSSFGNIPLVAVERIEVLTTGASAIYGSDAVAGVINIVLRNDISQTAVNVLWGTPTETKDIKNDWRFQFVDGRSIGDFTYSLMLEYRNREGILGEDYEQFDDQQDDYPFPGAETAGTYTRNILTLDRFLAAFGMFPRYRDPQALTGLLGDAACQQADSRLILADRSDAGLFCADPLAGVAAINFRNDNESWSINLTSNWELNERVSFFGDFLYNSSESESFREFLFVSDDIIDLTQPDTVGFGFFDWYLAQRLFSAGELGLDKLSTTFDEESWTLALGARGPAFDTGDWEFSLNHSYYSYDTSRPWFRYREIIDNVLGAYQGTSFFNSPWWSGGTIGDLPDNAFGFGDPVNLYGPVNEALRAAVGRQGYANDTERTLAQFLLRGDLFELAGRPVAYATVLELEFEEFEFTPDELTRQRPPDTDALGNPVPGLTGSGWYKLTGYAGTGDRDRAALAAELRVPLLDTLTVNLAGRIDEYDSGSTSYGSGFTPSVSAEFRPIDTLLFRAGYSESFRAPDLVQVFTGTGFFTNAVDLVRCLDVYNILNGTNFDPNEFESEIGLGDCESSSVFARRIGAQELDPSFVPLDAETGSNWWVGFSWDLFGSLTVQVDFQHFGQDNDISVEQPGFLLEQEWECAKGNLDPQTCSDVAARIIRSTDNLTGATLIEELNVTPFNRSGGSESEFIDARVFYTLALDRGTIDFQGTFTYALDDSQGGFRRRADGSLTWRDGGFATTLTGFYRGSTESFRCISQVTGEDRCQNGTNKVDPYVSFNWTAQYAWNNGLLGRIRFVNVFDESPPYDDTSLFFDQPWYNIFAYPGTGLGREVYLEGQWTF